MPEITKNGNPKGTITNAQIGSIFILIKEAGHTADQINARCLERFGKRISGLSKEEASLIIDAYKRPSYAQPG